MKAILPIKIGLAGLMTTPFHGPKEESYRIDIAAIEDLALKCGFELMVIREGIYSLEQAQNAANHLRQGNVDFILLQMASFSGGGFIYPFTDIQKPIGLWAVPEGPPTVEGGLPLNSFTALNMYQSIIKLQIPEYQYPVKWFFGRANDALFLERFELSVNALQAVKNLAQARVALVGGVAPGFDNLQVNLENLRNRLGVEVIELPFEYMLNLAIRIEDTDLIQKTAKKIAAPGKSLAVNMQGALKKTARLQIAYEQIAKEFALDAVAVSCWPAFQDAYGLGVCTLLGSLNDIGLVAACEGDVASAVGMLSLHYLSHGGVTTLMDLVTVDPGDDSILFWHCGPTAPSLADGNGVNIQPLWLFDGQPNAPMGLHNDLVLRPGSATMLGFLPSFDQLLVLEGEFDNQKPGYVGSRGWFRNITIQGEAMGVPTLVDTILKSGFQHHYPIAYGHLGDAAMELSGWCGIPAIQREKYHPYIKTFSKTC